MTLSPLESLDLRSEVESVKSQVIYAAKVKARIVKKYGLKLDSHEDYSLGKRLSVLLAEMRAMGLLEVYKDGNSRQYRRRR